jgi:hypothetical protein
MKKIAARTKSQHATVEALKLELKRIFGPTLDLVRPLSEIIDEANERLSDPKSVEFPPEMKLSLALKLSKSTNSDVRLLAVRTLPTKYAENLAFDSDPQIREAVAHRASPKVIDEMVKRYPDDDCVISVARSRKLLGVSVPRYLNEDALISPGGVEEPEGTYFDWSRFLVAEAKNPDGSYKKVSKYVAQWEGPELDDVWYENQAKLLIKKYDNNLERQWEEIACRQFVNASKSMGVEIDEKKLYDTLMKQLKDREDKRFDALDEDPLAEQPLKESVDWLLRGGYVDTTSLVPNFNYNENPVEQLLKSSVSSADYVRKFNSLFSVKESPVPAAIKKYRIGEVKGVMKVPVSARLPRQGHFTAIDERALDKYCHCWNELQVRNTNVEPMKVQWNVVPIQEGVVSFSVILR